jgi:c(7)-type cytochrome triheme protein
MPPSGPGTHQKCDGDDCHVKDFYDPKTFETTKVCTVCHVTKTRGLNAEFVPFPPLNPWWYADISHKRHTDSKDTKLGCDVCHRAKEDRVRHAACVDCHLNQKPAMTDCAGCHHSRFEQGSTSPKKVGPAGMPAPCRVSSAFRDKHPVHLEQKLHGRKVTCDHCHATVKAAESLTELVLTQGRKTMTVSCGPCHRDGGPSKVSLTGDCDKCHQDECMSTFSTIPAWHTVKGGPLR